MIKTIIFDLGNVIISFNHDRIINRLRELCRNEFAEDIGTIFHSDAIKDYDSGKISSTDFFRIICKKFDLKIKFKEFAEIWNSTFSLVPILPEETLKTLAAEFRLLILSDTNEIHFEFIKQSFPIITYFDDFVLSYEVGFAKPAGEIYRAAIEKAGCLPAECLFIDDRAGNVKAAEKLGISTIHFLCAGQLESELRMRNLLK